MPLEGAFRDRLHRPSRAPVETPWRPNLVVWSALDLIGALLCDRSDGLLYMAVGAGEPAWDAGPPAPDRSRRRLIAEVHRRRLEPGRTLTYDREIGRVRARVTLGRGTATGTLRELGLFGGDASARPGSGVLVNHAVHAAVVKGEDDALEREIILTLPPALLPGARDLIGGLLARRDGLRGITHIALGTRGDTPGEPPRELLDEAYRRALHPTALRYDAAAHAVEVQAEFGLGEGPADVREAGLFGGTATEGPSTGLLVARATGDPVDRRRPERLVRGFRLVLVERTDVTVPDLVGQSLVAARAGLAAVDLATGTVVERESEPDPPLSVLEQAPAAGAVVNEASPVALVIAVPPTVLVPQIKGEPESQATTLLGRLGLVVLGDARRERESREAPGTVLAASPPPGARVPKGTGVALTVAVPVQVTVPDVRGRVPAAAVVLLGAVGLAPEPEPEPPQESSATPGTIVVQAPEAGARVPVGTAVALTLATPWTTEVPDLRGTTAEQAARALAEAAAARLAELDLPPGIPGLALGAISERPDPAPTGTVVEHSPAAGARAPLYATVDIVLASVPALAVPRLVGLAEATATVALAAAGFALGKLTRRPADVAEGTILEQDPAPETAWPPGGRIDLTVAVPPQVVVPDLSGFALAAVVEALTARGLVLGTTSPRAEAGVPGTVVEQAPAAGRRVRAGTAVDVVVLQGVPNVVGMSRADAEAAIAAVGVPLGEVQGQEADRPPDIVLAQDPPAGSPLSQSTRISVIVSITPRVEVPAIVGTSMDSATRLLAELGLNLTVVDRQRSTEAQGTVLRQDPEPGERLDRGGEVGVTIAVTQLRIVIVPGLLGLTRERAQRVLDPVGLQLAVTGVRPVAGAEPGTVVDQQPAEGSRTRPGTNVVVTLASADDATEVPEVRRLSVADAVQTLQAAGLGLDVADKVASAEPEGTVLHQDPLPGTRMPVGAIVAVVLSAAGLVRVPDLVGTTSKDAAEQLRRLGLVVAAVQTVDLSRPLGTVIGQDPAPGAEVTDGSIVTIRVASRRMGPGGLDPVTGVPLGQIIRRPIQ